MRATALRTYRELLQAAWVREVPVGPVDETLARVGRILRDADIPFAVAGGFAVIEHGYERFTTDVDLLVYARDLPRAVNALRARGFRGARPLGAPVADRWRGAGCNRRTARPKSWANRGTSPTEPPLTRAGPHPSRRHRRHPPPRPRVRPADRRRRAARCRPLPALPAGAPRR